MLDPLSHVLVANYASLRPGQLVNLDWEPADQDGFSFRALRVWPQGAEPVERAPTTPAPGAYRSRLTITFDTEGPEPGLR